MDRDGATPRLLSILLLFIGVVFFNHGHRKQAEGVWQELDEYANRTHEPSAIILNMSNRSRLLTVDGMIEEAVENGLLIAIRGEELGVAPAANNYRFRVTIRPLLYLGRAKEAFEQLPMADAELDLTNAPWVRYVRPLVLAHMGNHSGANELLVGLSERSEGRLDADQICAFLETAVIVKDRETTSKLLPLLSNLSGMTLVGRIVRTCIARQLGDASAFLGESAQAADYYRQGIEVCEQVGFRPELALSRLGLAEVLLEHYPDERPEALEHLDFAIGEFQEMKMQPSLERALRHRDFLKA